jgi:hypothetical protein
MLEEILIAVAILVFGIPLIMNIAGPLLIWKTQKLPAIVKFQPIDDESFMEDRNAAFRAYDKSLRKHGFEVIGSSVLQDSHTRSFFRIYWSSKLKVSAMVVTMKSKVEEVTYLEITQQYDDGTALGVSNSPVAEAYPQHDLKLAFPFPGITSTLELLLRHAKLKSKYKTSAKPVDYAVEKGFYDVEEFLRRESDELLKKGIVKPEIDENGKRALTLRGAYALTYRAIPPGKYIWGYILQRRANAALRDA